MITEPVTWIGRTLHANAAAMRALAECLTPDWVIARRRTR